MFTYAVLSAPQPPESSRPSMQCLIHLANVSVLHLLVFTSRPVEVLCALLLGDPVEDEVVRRTQIFLLDCLCGCPVSHNGGFPPHVSERSRHHLGIHWQTSLL